MEHAAAVRTPETAPVLQDVLPPQPSSPSPLDEPGGQPPVSAGDATVFAEEGQWGTVSDSFDPQVIYHGTRLRGDASVSLGVAVIGDSVALRIRSLTKKEISSFVVQYLPWLAGAILAPFQHLLGLALVPLQFVLSVFSPFTVPFVWPMLILEGIGHLSGLVMSPVYLFQYVVQYFSAISVLFRGGDFVFMPRGLEIEDGTIATLDRGDGCQFIRLEVSDRLLRRVVKRLKKAEEEEMGLVGIVIGLFQLLLLPVTIPLSIVSGFFRMFGIGRKRRTLFALVKGTPVDFEKPAGLLSRWKKKTKESQDRATRLLYLINIAVSSADAFQEAVEKSLATPAVLVDDKLAKQTIWRSFLK